MTPIAPDVSSPDLSACKEQLAEPIHPVAHTGDYLRYDRLYDKIAEARREERDLPQGVWQRATKRADWRMVEELCVQALTERTKDLQLAVWLTEAWLHLRGLAGFTAGLEVIDTLHRNFALTMHPAPQGAAALSVPIPEDDPAVEHRMNMIQWLNEKLSIEVKLLPLTAPADTGSVYPFSLADIESAQLEEQMIRRQGAAASSQSQLHHLSRSIALTPEALLVSMCGDIRCAKDAANRLEATLDNCYARANSGLGRLRQILDDMGRALESAIPALAREPLPADRADGGFTAEGVGVDPFLSVPPNSISGLSLTAAGYLISARGSGAIGSREDAYMRLHEIADYLTRLEPHSPVPYLLRRAIAWGGMSLHELLPELLQDQASLRSVGHLLHLDK